MINMKEKVNIFAIRVIIMYEILRMALNMEKEYYLIKIIILLMKAIL